MAPASADEPPPPAARAAPAAATTNARVVVVPAPELSAAAASAAAPAVTPGDELVGDYTCNVTCTRVGTQRCADAAYACSIKRDARGTLRLSKPCCSFAWSLAVSKVTESGFVVTGDVCFGNGPCYGQGTITRRGPNSFGGRILAKDEDKHPVENDLTLVRITPKN